MFQWLFKYPPEVYEGGRLVFAPVLTVDPWLLGAAMAVLLLAAWLPARRWAGLETGRRVALAGLQAAFAAGALVLLARPAMEIATLAPGANSVAVLVDVSESMGFPDEGGRGSRLAAAETALEQTLMPRLASLAEVTTFSFGERAHRAEPGEFRPEAPRTRVVDSLEDVLASFRGAPLAAAIVISDGADNGSATPAVERLVSAGVPVHTVGVGPLTMAGEVQMTDVAVPSDAPPDSRIVADVVLRHTSSGPAEVKVYDGARLVASRAVELDPDTPTQRVSLGFDSGPGGIRELSFAVDPPSGDTLAGNNRLGRLLAVRERHRRALYLEGEPRWEYKFIRRALDGDAVVALTSWLRTTQRKTYRQNVADADEVPGGLPATRAELYAYDVLILGSLEAAYFSDEQHRWLETFVAERGGSLLALAGPDALADGGWDVRPLADALPVEIDRREAGTYTEAAYRARPTAAGLRAPVTQLLTGEGGDPWSTLPGLADLQRLGAVKPAATVLLETVSGGRSGPLLVSQPYGLGTAAVLATATTWRWRMRTPSGDQRHAVFWRQLVRQLAESAQRPRELRVDVGDAAVAVRLTERDRDFEPRRDVRAAATITGPGMDGERMELRPEDGSGVLSARFRPAESGIYRVDVSIADGSGRVDTRTRFVRLGADRLEQFDPVRNEPLLRRIAEVTGGRYWDVADVGGIAEALTFGAAGVKRTERFPVWDMPAAFLLLLALKSAEWWLRRRWGRI